MNQTIGISYLFSPYKMYNYGRQISNPSHSDIYQSADLKECLENEGIETYIHNVNQIQPVVSSGVRLRIKGKRSATCFENHRKFCMAV